MSIVESKRRARGQILQNEHGQYFFVCVACSYEFVTLTTFINHQNDAHNAEDHPIIAEDHSNIDVLVETNRKIEAVCDVQEVTAPLPRSALPSWTNRKKSGKKYLIHCLICE